MIKKIYIRLMMLLSIFMIAATSCKKDDDENVYKSLTLYQIGTKSEVSVADNIIGFQWKKSDALYTYNINQFKRGYYKLVADESSNSTTFTGRTVCDKNDEILVIYPHSCVDTVGSVTVLDLTEQNGSLESIGENAWIKLGKSIVTEASKRKSTATAQLYNEMTTELGLIKLSFTNEGKKLDDVTKVHISNISTSASIDLTASQGNNPPIVYKANVTGMLDLDEIEDGSVYISMFPGTEKPFFYVTAGGTLYEGKSDGINVSVGEITTATVEVKPISSSDYIEVGGVKWAPANFIYVDGSFKIADSEAIAYKEDSSDGKDVFNWGLCGLTNTNSVTDYLQTEDQINIEGKFYTSVEGTTRTYDIVNADYGDIVYRATNGKYRLPSYDDFYAIAAKKNETDHSVDGIKVEWTTVNGVNGCKVTDEGNGNSIFLPAAGQRDTKGTKSDVGTLGRYFTGRSSGMASAYVLKFDKDDFYITGDPQDNEYLITYKMLGCSIRPVLCE